jgi:hypothetical protein
LKISARWFQATGALVVVQIVLGGLASGGAIDSALHVFLGFVVLFAAAATLAVALTSKPSQRSVAATAGILALLVVLQVPLGYAMLNGDNALLSAVHIVNALAIAGTAFAGFFLARRWKNTIKG